MGKIISFFNQKGGVGKSTLTTLLSTNLAYHFGKKVLVLDADHPQLSIYKERQNELVFFDEHKQVEEMITQRYSQKGASFSDVVNFDVKDIKLIGNARDKYDFTFLDLTGSLNVDGILDAIKMLDELIVPINMLDNYDVSSSMEFVAAMLEKRDEWKINISIVVNMWDLRSQRRKGIEDSLNDLKTLKEYGIHVYNTKILKKASISHKLRSTVMPIPPIDATENMLDFVKEFVKLHK